MDIEWGDLCCPFSSKWMWICGLFLSIARNVDVKFEQQQHIRKTLNSNQQHERHSHFSFACGPCTHSLVTYALLLRFALVCVGICGITPHSHFVTYSIDRTNCTDWEWECPFTRQITFRVGWVSCVCQCVYAGPYEWKCFVNILLILVIVSHSFSVAGFFLSHFSICSRKYLIPAHICDIYIISLLDAEKQPIIHIISGRWYIWDRFAAHWCLHMCVHVWACA